MFGFKRACPFEFVEGGFGPSPSKIQKEDKASIYEATLQKLRHGARAAATSSSPSLAAVGGGLPHQNPGSAPREPQQQQRQQSQHLHHQYWYSSLNSDSGIQGKRPEVSDDSNSPMCDTTTAAGSPASEGTSFREKDLPLPRISSCGRPCYVCLFRAASSACSHCSRDCCEACCRRCEQCQEHFCSVCSTVDYEQRYDRSFCFDCGARASSTQSRSFVRPYHAHIMGCP